MSTIKTIDLIYVDAKANNNKWWRAELSDNDDVVCNWGRVGAPNGQVKTFCGAGESFMEKKANEKKKKGRSFKIDYFIN